MSIFLFNSIAEKVLFLRFLAIFSLVQNQSAVQ